MVVDAVVEDELLREELPDWVMVVEMETEVVGVIEAVPD